MNLAPSEDVLEIFASSEDGFVIESSDNMLEVVSSEDILL